MIYNSLELVSHHLCPYVQRSVITLTEKDVPHERLYIDLGNKPEWFLALSPTGKVPLLKVDDQHILFESAVICEFLDEVTPGSLHPENAVLKAEHRAWNEFASQILNNIAKLYNAKTIGDYQVQTRDLNAKFKRLENVVQLPYFAGNEFCMVDAAFGPVFRYFDTIEPVLPENVFAGCEKITEWRETLANRPSVKSAVDNIYPKNLESFLIRRHSFISDLIASHVSLEGADA